MYEKPYLSDSLIQAAASVGRGEELDEGKQPLLPSDIERIEKAAFDAASKIFHTRPYVKVRDLGSGQFVIDFGDVMKNGLHGEILTLQDLDKLNKSMSKITKRKMNYSINFSTKTLEFIT